MPPWPWPWLRAPSTSIQHYCSFFFNRDSREEFNLSTNPPYSTCQLRQIYRGRWRKYDGISLSTPSIVIVRQNSATKCFGIPKTNKSTNMSSHRRYGNIRRDSIHSYTSLLRLSLNENRRRRFAYRYTIGDRRNSATNRRLIWYISTCYIAIIHKKWPNPPTMVKWKPAYLL